MINQSINLKNVGHFFSLDFKTCLCCTLSLKVAKMQKSTGPLKNFQLAWQSCHCHWLVSWRVQKRRNFDVCLLWILITIFSMWKSNHYSFSKSTFDSLPSNIDFLWYIEGHLLQLSTFDNWRRRGWWYLIFVTGATGGARVNFFGRCKFLKI